MSSAVVIAIGLVAVAALIEAFGQVAEAEKKRRQMLLANLEDRGPWAQVTEALARPQRPKRPGKRGTLAARVGSPSKR